MDTVRYTAEAVVEGGWARGRGGSTLSVSLDLHGAHLSADDATDLMARAHKRCPCSNATRGNIDVQLTVDGAPKWWFPEIPGPVSGGCGQGGFRLKLGVAKSAFEILPSEAPGEGFAQ